MKITNLIYFILLIIFGSFVVVTIMVLNQPTANREVSEPKNMLLKDIIDVTERIRELSPDIESRLKTDSDKIEFRKLSDQIKNNEALQSGDDGIVANDNVARLSRLLNKLSFFVGERSLQGTEKDKECFTNYLTLLNEILGKIETLNNAV